VVPMLLNDLVAADEELANAERRAAGLGFPQGPYSLGYARFVATWIRIEAGQLHRAAASAADLLELAERHGFDQWRMVGATQQSTIAALSVINAERPNRSELSAHLATIADLTDMMLKLGLAIYGTAFAAHLARLLIAVGQTAQAREHLDLALGLADATGMAFYNAELVRLRALTLPDEQERLAEIAKSAELARAHGATLFELRATIDDFELRGEAAYAALADVLARSPHGWPEYQRAQALLANSGYSAK
jgi:hypothetical protein